MGGYYADCSFLKLHPLLADITLVKKTDIPSNDLHS